MKCDDCYYKAGYVLGSDECGAGHWMDYCAKNHWAGGVPDDEDPVFGVKDPWKNCKDYSGKTDTIITGMKDD